MYDRVFGQVRVQYLIPTNHFFAEFLKDLRQVLVEVSLKSVVVLDSFRFHESLDLCVAAPLVAFVFISSDVDVLVREKLSDLCKKPFEKFVKFLTCGVKRRFKYPVLALDLVRSRRAPKLRMPDQPACCVARHIELGHHSNAPLAGISYDLARLILGVVKTVRTHLMKARIAFRFDSKPLVFCQVPVQHVQLDRSHPVEIALEYFDRLKMAPGVYEQPPPGKPRLILNADRRNKVSLTVSLKQL